MLIWKFSELEKNLKKSYSKTTAALRTTIFSIESLAIVCMKV